MSDTLDLDAIWLATGSHPNDDEMCVMEATAMMAGEPKSDHPRCASPVIASFLRSWNDVLDDDDRQQLKQYIEPMIGTRGTAEQEDARAWLCLDWLVRSYTPAWLRTAGLTDQAALLSDLPEFCNGMDVPSVKPTITAVRKDADAAGDAARDAARAAARDAARDAAWAAAGAAAWDAARAAAWDAARAAAGDAAWDAAGDAAGAAAWDAAGAAARAAAWDAAGAAAWDAAGDAAWDAAGAAAGDAAWDAAGAAARAAAWAAAGAAAGDAAGAAARAAAWDAAGAAARDAAGDAAWAAAWDAAGAAARAAAWDALRPTVVELQASAHELVARLIAA